MCGIAGINQDTNSSGLFLRDNLISLGNHFNQHHYRRGPDANGIFISDGLQQLMCHTRLSILDLDKRANQPMRSQDTKHVITFNGEIYNFRELKQNYLSNHVFKTTSDTEVILELYKRFGVKFLPKLRGMFAIAIWDESSNELILIRDSLGIKPLYFYESNGFIAFSSTVQSIYNSFISDINIEEAGLVGFLLAGSVPEPWTIYKNIFPVPKGGLIRIKNGKVVEESQWMDFKKYIFEPPSLHLNKKEVINAISQSVKSHLVSDVPVGTFLSAGIDSVAISSHATENQNQIEGININFSEFSNTLDDEYPLAKQAAAEINIDFHSKRITRHEFLSDLDDIFLSMDQPSIDGLNTWYASKFASALNYKVVLSGVGGDELFCGYSTFKRAQLFYKFYFLLNNPLTKNSSRRLISYLFGKSSNKSLYISNYLSSLKDFYAFLRAVFLKEELENIIDQKLLESGLKKLNESNYKNRFFEENENKDTLKIISALEFEHYLGNQLLRDSDWASMAHSLELRTPLVDLMLIKDVGKYISFFKNKIGKKLLADSPRNRVPKFISQKRKTGFSFPLSHWMSELDLHENEQKKLDDTAPWQKKWALHIAKPYLDKI